MIDNITSLRKVQLELLQTFTKICEGHGLSYYAFYGTLLGISRGEGYLTWDDDIDVAMPMKDYLALCSHREWFDSETYYLQTPLDYGLCHFAKLRRNGTTAFREDFIDCLKNEGHQGISMDIIPLADLPGMGAYHTPAMLGADKKSAVYLKEWFEPHGTGLFEGISLDIPRMSRKVLNETYGDWAWPHGVRESTRPSYWFFDTKKGYEHYIQRYTGMLEGIDDKKIVFFGAADSLRIWLERFGRRRQVVCTFDNDAAKWGGQAYGVDVKNPAELPALMDGDTRLIIVSLYHHEIGRQLERMGIEDYYVYIDNYYDEKIGNPVVRREDAPNGELQIPKWG